MRIRSASHMRLPAAMREKAVAFEKLAKPQALKSRQMCPGHALDAISAPVAHHLYIRHSSDSSVNRLDTISRSHLFFASRWKFRCQCILRSILGVRMGG